MAAAFRGRPYGQGAGSMLVPPGSGSGSPAPDPAEVLGGVGGGEGGEGGGGTGGVAWADRDGRGSVRMPVPVDRPVPLRRVPLPRMRRLRLRRLRRRDGSHRDRSRPGGHGRRSRRAGRPVADGRDRQHRQRQRPQPARGSPRPGARLPRQQPRQVLVVIVVEQPGQSHHLGVVAGLAGLVTAPLELVQALCQRLVPGCGRLARPTPRAVGPVRHHPRRAGSQPACAARRAAPPGSG